MNDEHSGQLTSAWRIPPYAQGALWIEAEGSAVPTEGDYGLFTLPAPAQMLTVRWSRADGPALARLPWRVDSLDWDGTARAGGYIEALHLAAHAHDSHPITAIYLGGQPLKHTLNGPPTRPDFYSGLAADVGKSTTTWLVHHHSPLADLARQALLHGLRVHLFGRLLGEEGEDGTLREGFALPLLLQAITVFGA